MFQTVFVRPLLLPAANLARLAAGSSNGLTNTWRCMCSFELLMIDGKIRLKHVERLTEINKLWNVASCWLYFANILAMRGPMNVKFTDSCLNKGWPTRWHLLYYILLNMFQTLIRPFSGASEYLLCCVGWLEACWYYVAGLAVGGVVSECRLNHYVQPTLGYHTTNRQNQWFSLHADTTSPTDRTSGSAYTRIPHHQQTIPPHNTSTPQVSLHNTTRTR